MFFTPWPGVSTVATFAESTAGVADGAKTGLAPLVTGAAPWVTVERPVMGDGIWREMGQRW